MAESAERLLLSLVYKFTVNDCNEYDGSNKIIKIKLKKLTCMSITVILLNMYYAYVGNQLYSLT